LSWFIFINLLLLYPLYVSSFFSLFYLKFQCFIIIPFVLSLWVFLSFFEFLQFFLCLISLICLILLLIWLFSGKNASFSC
jgi:hypothetical protein